MGGLERSGWVLRGFGLEFEAVNEQMLVSGFVPNPVTATNLCGSIEEASRFRGFRVACRGLCGQFRRCQSLHTASKSKTMNEEYGCTYISTELHKGILSIENHIFCYFLIILFALNCIKVY